MSRSAPQKSPVSGVVHSLADLGGDLLEILELQVGLARNDVKDAAKASIAPAIALVSGISMMVAALPVIGLSLASVLKAQSGLPSWAAELLVGVAMCAIAVALCCASIFKLKKAVSLFGRSISELSKNISWLKSIARREDQSEL